MLNRSAIIIRPKEPYINWASQLDKSGLLPDKNAEPSIYLIPEYHDDADAWALLEQRFESIFDAELEAWHRQPTDWPKDRSFSMFKRWFQINFVSLITDLCEGPIKKDDD